MKSIITQSRLVFLAGELPSEIVQSSNKKPKDLENKDVIDQHIPSKIEATAIALSKSQKKLNEITKKNKADLLSEVEKKEEKLAKKEIGEALAPFEMNTKMLAESEMTPEVMQAWYKNTNSIFQIAFHKAYLRLGLTQPEDRIKRFAYLSTVSIMSLWINQAIGTLTHELGHKTVADAQGVEGWLENGGKRTNIGSFFVSTLGSFEERAYCTDDKTKTTSAENAAFSAAGLNANSKLAENTVKKIQTSEGHMMDGAPYAMNKIVGSLYFLKGGISSNSSEISDSENYVLALEEQGYKVNKNDIIKLQAASFLLSGGTWSLLNAATQFVWNGKEKVEPIGVQVGGTKIMMPELTTWLNSDNVSLGAKTLLKNNKLPNTSFIAGLEAAILGNKNVKPEITAGVITKKGKWSVEAEATSNGSAPYMEGKVSRKLPEINPDISAFVKGTYGRGKTEREQREHPGGSKGVSAGVEWRW